MHYNRRSRLGESMKQYLLQKENDKYLVFLKNKKGFYNFIEYINSEEVENFLNKHKKEEIIVK